MFTESSLFQLFTHGESFWKKFKFYEENTYYLTDANEL